MRVGRTVLNAAVVHPSDHMSLSMLSTSSFPTMSRKMIASSRASQPPLNPQRALHLRGCRFYVVLFPRRSSLQQQVGCEIPIRPHLAPRLHLSDEARRVL